MQKNIFTLTLLAFTFAPVAAADHPDPSEMRIGELQYKGNGCEPGSVAANISPDAKAFTLLFDNFLAEKNGNDRRPVRKTCKIDVHLHTTSGWQFGFVSVDHRGFVDLENGLNAGLATSYNNDHRGRPVRFSPTIFKGPVSEDYYKNAQMPVRSVQWTPCNNGGLTHFTIDSDITIVPAHPVRDRGAAGLLTVDSIDGAYQQVYGFTWKRCQVGHHDDDGDGDHGDGDHGDDDHGDDDHGNDGNDFSGFTTTKTMAVAGPGFGNGHGHGRRDKCNMIWNSTRPGQLVLATDECTPLVEAMEPRFRKIYSQRLRHMTASAMQEFEKWKRRR